MPDIELGGGFSWGSIRSGMEQMRSFVRQTTTGIQGDVAKMFTPAGLGGLLSVAFIERGISSVVEYGAKVSDLARRFAVSSTDIQQFGNAAEKSGASMESVAMGFNRLDVSRSKALGGNKQLIESFANLGISAEDLQHLSLPELMLKIGASSMNAADMVKILGRNGTELRQTLQKLADGTEALSAAIDPEHIKAIKRADDAWKMFTENARAYAGNTIGPLTDFWKLISGQAGPGGIDPKLLEANQERLSKLGPLEHARQMAELEKIQQGKYDQYQKPIGPEMPEPGAAGSGAGSQDVESLLAGGGGDAAARKAESLRDKIAKLEEEHMAKQRTDQEQLNALLAKNVELYKAQATVGDDDNATLEARQAFLENQVAVDTLTAKMAKDKLETDSKITAEREKAGAEADQQLAKAKAGNEVLQLELAGQHDLAEQKKIENEYDEKIAKAQKDLETANEKGFTDVADTNQKLIEQLTLEKQNAVAATQKAQAEKAAAAATELHNQDLKEAEQLHRQDVEGAQKTLADLREQRAENEQLKAGHTQIAQEMRDEYAWQAKINDATQAANDAWEKMNEAYTEGKTLLGDQYAELAKINEATARELDLQKQISAQLENQNRWAKGMQDLANNLGSAAEAGVDFTGGLGKDPRVLAAMTAGFTLSPYALTKARDPNTGQIDINKLISAMIEYDAKTAHGTKNLGFMDQANIDALDREFARLQTQQGLDATRQGLAFASQQRNQFAAAFQSGDISAFLDPILRRLDAIKTAQDTTTSKLTSLPGSH